MPDDSARKIAFVSSYLPDQCGIATFTNDLIRNIASAAGPGFEPLVVALHSEGGLRYRDPVKFEVRRNVKNDYLSAADFLNFSHVDLISVQHEYGLFGGEAGSYLNLLLSRAKAPIVTTLHTVLEEPPQDYFQATLDVCRLSDRVVVMNQRGVDMLRDIYHVDGPKVSLIPHGIPDLAFVDSSYYKHKFGLEGRKTILTFGLLSRNKGIEMMLRALPEIVKVDPSVLYIILGATHPGVLRHEGEAYRFSLQRMVKDLGLEKNVLFHNRFVSDEKLHNFLCAADLYVTPYRNREQLTSGTLAFAVGAGKAVISTPYWAAEELLDDGRGVLVKFDDPRVLAQAVTEILSDDMLFYRLRRKAYDYGRERTWPTVGRQYWDLFARQPAPTRIFDGDPSAAEDALSILEVPEPPLEHLMRLTDDTGLVQHAKFIIPDRDHGYCTDDNARALVAMVRHYAQYSDPKALQLFDRYISFLFHAQHADGTVHNFMCYDRQWMEDEPLHDALGRTLWALGAVMARPPLPRYIPIVKDRFDLSVKHVPVQSIRGMAYSIFGMADYLAQFPGASDIKRYFAAAADFLLGQYSRYCRPGWHWYEDILAYDNAVLPHAMYIAAMAAGNDKYLRAAEESCRFLLNQTYNGNHFSFIGCDGWYPRGGRRAQFDQQPLEVMSTVMMLRAAYDATQDAKYLRLQRKAFDWFFGENDLRTAVYDFRTKGSGDGLQKNGVNLNQGAESMISFLLSLLSIVESYSIAEQSGLERKSLKRMKSHSTLQTAMKDGHHGRSGASGSQPLAEEMN